MPVRSETAPTALSSRCSTCCLDWRTIGTLLLTLLVVTCLPACRQSADPSQVLVVRARDQLEIGNREEARKLLTQALDLNPDNPAANYAMGVLDLQDLDRHSAVAHLSKAVEGDPENLSYLPDYAVALMAAGRTGEGLAVLDRYLERRPGDVRALTAMANARLAAGDLEAALELYERALRIDARNPVVAVNKADVLIEMGRLEEAVDLLDKAEQALPTYMLSYWRAGEALRRLGRLAEAQEHLERAVELAPKFPQAAGDLAAVMALRGVDLDRAAQLAERAVTQAGGLRAHFDVVAAYVAFKQGKLDDALKRFQKAISWFESDAAQQPDRVARVSMARGYRYYAEALDAAGRADEANAARRRADELWTPPAPGRTHQTQPVEEGNT